MSAYRCPGCDQLIPPGVPHVVAWPEDGDAVDERRHWHRACWAARHDDWCCPDCAVREKVDFEPLASEATGNQDMGVNR